MKRWILCALLACGIACAAASGATNRIVQYNQNLHEDTHYSINQANKSVTILLGIEGEAFDLEAGVYDDPNDPNTYVEPGDINFIIADPNAGPVWLKIFPLDGHEYAARHVGQIDLSAAGVTGTIGDLYISGNLAEFGPVLAGQADYISVPNGVILDDVELDVLTGWVWCYSMHGLLTHWAADGTAGVWIGGSWGRDGLDTIYISDDLDTLEIGGWTSGTIKVGDVEYLTLKYGVTLTGDVTAYEVQNLQLPSGDLLGTLTVHYLHNGEIAGGVQGTLHVPGDWTGVVFVHGAITGQIVIDDDMERFGMLWTHANMSGLLKIGGNAFGILWVGSTYLAPMFYRSLTGRVEIGGMLQNTEWRITGNLGDANDPNNPTKGQIRINGSFQPPYSIGIIRVGGALVSAGSYVTVDYDGWDPNDAWASGASVIVEHRNLNDPNAPYEPVTFTGNSPEDRIFETTSCKADLDNTGAVDFRDINPFVLALSNPSAYAETFPGIAGSMVFHGDLNCDGTLGLADINPFVLRVTEGCCDPECGSCYDERGGEPLSPQELAALLAANVDSELFDSLVALVAANAAQQDNEEDAAYWEAVYYALIE